MYNPIGTKKYEVEVRLADDRGPYRPRIKRKKTWRMKKLEAHQEWFCGNQFVDFAGNVNMFYYSSCRIAAEWAQSLGFTVKERVSENRLVIWKTLEQKSVFVGESNPPHKWELEWVVSSIPLETQIENKKFMKEWRMIPSHLSLDEWEKSRI